MILWPLNEMLLQVIIITNTLFGQVKGFIFVIKFQSRGNEHNHGLLWIKDAPKYGIDSNDKIESFIDKYITCDKCLLPWKSFWKSTSSSQTNLS